MRKNNLIVILRVPLFGLWLPLWSPLQKVSLTWKCMGSTNMRWIVSMRRRCVSIAKSMQVVTKWKGETTRYSETTAWPRPTYDSLQHSIWSCLAYLLSSGTMTSNHQAWLTYALELARSAYCIVWRQHSNISTSHRDIMVDVRIVRWFSCRRSISGVSYLERSTNNPIFGLAKI